MNKQQQLLSLVILGLTMSLSARAMNEENLSDYIKLANLSEIMIHTPDNLGQRSSELQSWYALAWAYLEQLGSLPEVSIISEGNRNFKHYASPSKLAEFINDRFPSKYYRASAMSTEKLETYELLEIVRKNLRENIPVLIYNYDGNHIFISMIVGYKEQEETMLLILSQNEQSKSCLKTVGINTVVKLMNLSLIIKRFKNFNFSVIRSNVTAKLQEINQEFVCDINTFNILTFNRPLFKNMYRIMGILEIISLWS